MNQEHINISLHTFVSPKLQSIVEEATIFIHTTPFYPLPPVSGFSGVGVYALYYLGDFPLYDYISRQNQTDCTQPIYVGKAVPTGWRTARKAKGEKSRELYGRLREHARSIDASENLRVADFRCRFMIFNGVEADLIAAVESNLIRRNLPLWNTGLMGLEITIRERAGTTRPNRSGMYCIREGYGQRASGEMPRIQTQLSRRLKGSKSSYRFRSSTTDSYNL